MYLLQEKIYATHVHPSEIISPDDDLSIIHGVYGWADCLDSGTRVFYINKFCL